jgi:hypothetical protein|tara:strand:- start:21 stop:155 length:135 start_codon:yes stop_codon:yes gene_type:complete
LSIRVDLIEPLRHSSEGEKASASERQMMVLDILVMSVIIGLFGN